MNEINYLTELNSQTIDYTIDARGLRCPDTLIIVRKRVRTMINGKTLLIITDDLATIRDIPSFCDFMEHTLLAQVTKKLPFFFILRK